jgi:hypothetical protein
LIQRKCQGQEVARNLGSGPLEKVLGSLPDKMHLKGMMPPFGWDRDLAEQAGRVGP